MEGVHWGGGGCHIISEDFKEPPVTTMLTEGKDLLSLVWGYIMKLSDTLAGNTNLQITNLKTHVIWYKMKLLGVQWRSYHSNLFCRSLVTLKTSDFEEDPLTMMADDKSC